MPLRRLLPVLRSRNLLIALSLFAITTVAARSLMRSGSPHSIRQAKAGGTALQVEVLRSSDPPILARAGATISIQSNFRYKLRSRRMSLLPFRSWTRRAPSPQALRTISITSAPFFPRPVGAARSRFSPP